MNTASQPSPEPILIRPMKPEDLEQVQAIDQISFSMPWPSSAYRYEIYENPLSLLWVAEASLPASQSKIVGLIVVWLILDEAHIATVAVHPDYRSRGVAQCLLTTALKEAIKKGSREATLEVRASNTIAQRLYRRFHFEIVGNRVRYYRDNNEDALIMTVGNLDGSYLEWLESGAWKDRGAIGTSAPGECIVQALY